MSYTVKQPIALVAIFVWIGFVLAISFMEAWLKFRAPGITLALGLGIGRLVFAALNKVEIILFMIVLANLILSGALMPKANYIPFVIVFIILITQTAWLLPALDARAELHIQGLEVPRSNLHFYYVGIEFLKVICLSFFGLILFNK